MLHGKAKLFVDKAELIHAVDCYFYAHVRDNGLDPYATVTDIEELDDERFVICLEGKPCDEPEQV